MHARHILLWGVLMVALLTIGTATDRIDLLSGSGWHLSSWKPVASDHASTVGQSALADGQQVESYREINISETFVLELGQPTQNMADRATQDMRRMLQKVLDYWATNHQPEPVYIARRTPCETNISYTLVHDARLPEDSPPFQEPFTGAIPGPTASGMDEMILQVEHGPWLEVPPGEQVCVPASATGSYYTQQSTVTARPAASTDDGTYVSDTGMWLDGGLALYLGKATGGYSTGIRFTGLNVPQGATIVQAYITFVADASEATPGVSLIIAAEDQDDAATYASAGDFLTRPKTDANVAWSPGAWVLGTSYNTIDLSPPIQEVINRPGWVAGNDIGIYIKDFGSVINARRSAASWDNLVRTEPILTVVYSALVSYGQAETCDEGVFVANKNNTANITHIYRENGGAWEGNLFGAIPYALFPAAPVQNNDAVYFGILSAPATAGPFSSLAFNINPAAVWVGATAHAHYEYWNGGWVALTVVDNTTPVLGQPFRSAGVGSLHFVPPADWTPNNPGMGVTAWWIRIVVQLGGGDSVTVPTQTTRDVYTVTWGSCMVDADQVPGDIPALLRLILHGPSGKDSSWVSTLGSDKVVMGLRSTDRGVDFSAYINLSGTQNPTGITVFSSPAFTITANPAAVTGEWCVLTPPVPAAPPVWTRDGIYLIFDATRLSAYNGTFRALVRAQLVPGAGGGAGDIGLRLAQSAWPYIPSSTVYSKEYYNKHVSINELFDLGQITLPAYPWWGGITPDNYYVMLEYRAMDDDFTVIFHDLILIPVDEWAAGVESWEELTTAPDALLYTLGEISLDIDGVLDPKHVGAHVCNYNVNGWTGAAYGRLFAWIYSANRHPSLQPNRQQRLWMVGSAPHWDGLTLYRNSSPHLVHQVQLFRNARYKSARGDR